MSTLDQIAADELLGRLSHQQAEQARAVAAATSCPWCLELGCDGSASRCEEYENRIDLEHQVIRAPEIRTPFRTGTPA